MKPPARPTSPAPRQAPPAPRAAPPAARATQTAPRTTTTTRPAPRDHKKLVIIGAVVVVALAILGYGLSRPTTPWVFDSPEAKKSYVH
jgi:hypothetical protein